MLQVGISPGFGLGLTCSAFHDTLTGDAFDNILIGGAGNDTLTGGEGGETAGDTASYADAGLAVSVNLFMSAQDTGGAGFDTLTEIENIIGSAFNDTLLGDTAVNTLTGGDGDDMLNGGDGNDTLIGGLGNDTLIGAAGNDTLTGGGGDDFFQFANETVGPDTIMDFLSGDQIVIQTGDPGEFNDGVDALPGTNPEDGEYFVSDSGRAATADHAQFLFDTDDNRLWWDASGNTFGGMRS